MIRALLNILGVWLVGAGFASMDVETATRFFHKVLERFAEKQQNKL